MAKTTLFKGVVYLSDEQYNKLVTDGVIEVGGQTITYDESMVYITPKALPTDYYTKSEVEEKLSQTISKPLIAPTATELVAVDNTNSQTMLAIGDGLSIEDGILKASGGAGSSKLYRHHIVVGSNGSQGMFVCDIINNISTNFTYNSLVEYFVSHNILDGATGITCQFLKFNIFSPAINVVYFSQENNRFTVKNNGNLYLNIVDNVATLNNNQSTNTTLSLNSNTTDTVTEL